MAAELVGGAFLSASLQVLFDRIASREVLDHVRGKRHYGGLLEKLKIKLLSVNVVLDDAELKQIRNPAVKMWLDELKYAADDADNLLDDISTDALERKVMEAEPRTSTSNVRKIFSNFFHSKDQDRVTKIEEILGKLEYIAQQKDDALQAKLMDKKNLEELELEWGNETSDTEHEKNILDKLSPNSKLKRLEIRGYGGTTFPNWVGDRSLCSNIVDLSLANCKYCHSLPPLGQLFSLKSLKIESFDGIVSVGAEFYGNCSSVVKPFASLEFLQFFNMPSWKVWSMPVEDVDEAFPKLRQLTGDLPHFLHSLTSLGISFCAKLACSLPKMPIVSTILLDYFKKPKIDSYSFTENRSLQDLTIWGAGKFVFLMESSYESLESLSLSDPPASLKLFPLDSFPKIKHLEISDSPNLKSISVSDRLCQGLTSLSSLIISECPNFIMFHDGFTFPSLTSLCIMKCDRLKFLPETLHNLFPSLQSLSICNCPEVESFSVTGLPLKLQELTISDCKKLINSRMSCNLKTLPNLTTFQIWRSDIFSRGRVSASHSYLS